MLARDLRPLYLSETLLFARHVNVTTESLLTTINVRRIGPKMPIKVAESEENIVATIITQNAAIIPPQLITTIKNLEKAVKSYHSERTYIENTWIYHGEKQNTIKAKGNIQKGTFLHEIRGVLVPLNKKQAEHAKKFKYDFSIMERTSEGTTKTVTDQMLLGILRLVNHACKSYNAEYYYAQDGTITLRTIKNILQHEDLLVQYAEGWTPNEHCDCICRDHFNAFDSDVRMRHTFMLQLDQERELTARRKFMRQNRIRE
jgi:hypothetical protein